MVSDFIPIVGMLTFFGFFAVVLIFLVVYNYRRQQLRNQEIMAAIEKGIEVPFPPPKKRNYLHLGLIWTLVGIAFTLALWFSTRHIQAAVWGFLPIAVGIAFLLIAYFERKAEEGEESA